jgi:hypothetical protein
MLYFGVLCTEVFDWGAHRDDGFHCVRGRFFCMHAYAVHRRMFDDMRRLHKETPEETPVDDMLISGAHQSRAVYAWEPQFVIQSPGWSDLVDRYRWRDFKWPAIGEMFSHQ